MRYWYRDDDISIMFDYRPQVGVRVILPTMTIFEKNSIKKYPFINKRELKVRLEDAKKRKSYVFSIPKGYQWDGATIPRIFWKFIGSKTDSAFLIPSLIHDVLCENKEYVEYDRFFADCVFEKLLYVSGVSAIKRFIMFISVEIYQGLFGKWRLQ